MVIMLDEYQVLWKFSRLSRMPSCWSDSRLPQRKRRSCESSCAMFWIRLNLRHASFYRDILYSESTAFISRAVYASPNRGQRKNCAKRSRASPKASFDTSK